MTDSLDLVPIGAYLGRGKRKGLVSKEKMKESTDNFCNRCLWCLSAGVL